MKRIIFLSLLLVLMVGCRHQQQETSSSDLRQIEPVAVFRLGEHAELELLTDSTYSQVELYYGGEFQELAGTANTLFVTDSANRIVLDTVSLGSSGDTQYVIRTYDRSSTYGAEVWYVVYPYRTNEPDGPWSLVKIPTDRPTLEDVARYIN